MNEGSRGIDLPNLTFNSSSRSYGISLSQPLTPIGEFFVYTSPKLSESVVLEVPAISDVTLVLSLWTLLTAGAGIVGDDFKYTHSPRRVPSFDWVLHRDVGSITYLAYV